MQEFKAVWEGNTLQCFDGLHTESVRRNADELARHIGKSIMICCGIRGCNAVQSLYDACMNPDISVNRMSDRMPMFDRKRDNISDCMLRFNLFRKELFGYSRNVFDNGFTLVSGKNVIGCGWSPYIVSEHLHDLELVDDLTDIINRIMHCVSVSFRQNYDVLILSPDKTICALGKTVSIVFLKRLR